MLGLPRNISSLETETHIVQCNELTCTMPTQVSSYKYRPTDVLTLLHVLASQMSFSEPLPALKRHLQTQRFKIDNMKTIRKRYFKKNRTLTRMDRI